MNFFLLQVPGCDESVAEAGDGSECRESRRRRVERDEQLQGSKHIGHPKFKVGHSQELIKRINVYNGHLKMSLLLAGQNFYTHSGL